MPPEEGKCSDLEGSFVVDRRTRYKCTDHSALFGIMDVSYESDYHHLACDHLDS